MTIGVSGLPGTVVKARATLHGVVHSLPSEIDALLVAPGGQKTILMSDACGSSGLTGTGETFTFDDAAPGPLTVTNASCVGKSGVYKPTDGPSPPADAFPAPAPSGPYVATLSAFNGAAVNGTWQLFAQDDGPSDFGSIAGGWSLELLPSVRCSGKDAKAAATVGTAGNDVLIGTPAADIMVGLDGNDKIRGLGGNDVICGSDGRDTLKGGPGKDLLRGEAGRDQLQGGQGGKDFCSGGFKRDTAKGCEKERTL